MSANSFVGGDLRKPREGVGKRGREGGKARKGNVDEELLL